MQGSVSKSFGFMQPGAFDSSPAEISHAVGLHFRLDSLVLNLQMGLSQTDDGTPPSQEHTVYCAVYASHEAQFFKVKKEA